MERIEKLAVTWSGLLPVITKTVAGWKPPKLKSELAYRNDLLALLRQVVPEDAKVEKEFRHRGTTIDIWLGWKGIIESDELAFELKVNLKKKADFDRLVGQIEGLEPRKNKVLVVLIGDTDPGYLGRLEAKYADQIKASPPSLAIVQILVSEQ